jgi:NMD protein affecting ribosome stability and mRNA decay
MICPECKIDKDGAFFIDGLCLACDMEKHPDLYRFPDEWTREP